MNYVNYACYIKSNPEYSPQKIKMLDHALLFFIFCVLSLASTSQISATTSRRPNVVFILTDDQDAKLNSLDYMPSVRKHLISRGTHFKSHYCTVAWCCPSRVSLWTGKAAHNTNVTNIKPPYGTNTKACWGAIFANNS